MKTTIQVKQNTVNYVDQGVQDGPVVIFIHGFPFNLNTWNGQVEALKDTYRVITYDVRGHGKSSHGSEAFSIDLFAEDLIGLMDALEIKTAIVCGLSMGGYIALRAIADHPERFEGLILSDTQCVADSPEGKEKRMKTIESINTNGVKAFADEMVKKLFAPDSLSSHQDGVEMIREMMIHTSVQSLSDTLRALANRRETCSTLEDIKVPTLILVGKEDPITPVAAAQTMHEKIEGSALHVIHQAAHLPNIENADDFNFQLKLFLHRFAKKPLSTESVVD